MVRKRERHLHKERGRWVWRVGHGERIKIPGEYGSDEFNLAVEMARAGNLEALKNRVKNRASSKTLEWLLNRYMASPAFLKNKPSTQTQYRTRFAHIVKKAGELDYRTITTEQLARTRDAIAAGAGGRPAPAAANAFVKLISPVFKWACHPEQNLLKVNPCLGLDIIARPKTEGHHTWTEQEIAQFEAQWPLGTPERLALDVLLYTGGRRSDAVRLGNQMVRGNVLIFTPEKTDAHEDPVEVRLPILAPLAASLAAAKVAGLKTWIVDERGQPRAGDNFGRFFKRACIAAGLSDDCTAHGLRKAACTRCAEAGAGVKEMMALFGWKDVKIAMRYCEAADKARMAQRAAHMMLHKRGAEDDVIDLPALTREQN